MSDIWRGLPAATQDWIILVALMAPGLLLGAAALRGHRAGPLIGALLRRHRWTNLAVVALIALSVALGVAVSAQERALRQGAAQAAARFPVVVAAPGDQMRALLATIYLQPTDMPLLSGAMLARLQDDPLVALAAPIAFGDSVNGAPVVGVTTAFITHLAGAAIEGRTFAALDEAVVGAASLLQIGDSFTSAHGPAEGAGAGHDGVSVTVVGRMAATGGPWDRAILTPIEHVWWLHGLADGHAPDNAGQLGPPFDPAYVPGAPAVVVVPKTLAASYAMLGRYDGGESMAFLPATTLARLLVLVGDVRAVMSLMAGLTQVLVVGGVLLGLLALMRLFARRLALLRALGAPRRFVFAVVWGYAAALIAAGTALGLLGGVGAAAAVSALIEARAELRVAPTLGLREAQMAAAFFTVAAFFALAPAFAAYRRPVAQDLAAA